MGLVIGKKKLIRHFVSMALKLKYIPELRFYYDNTFEYAEKIDKMINKLNHND